MTNVDHRPVSPLGTQRGSHGFLDTIRALFQLASDARTIYEPLGEVDRVAVHRGAWVGHWDEIGGAVERPWRGVVVARGDELAEGEVFDVDDEAGALRALCRLVGGADGAPGPVTGVWCRASDAFERRAWDDFQACFAADPELVDHRRTVSLVGVGAVERAQGFVAQASDVVLSVEPLAEVDGVAMVINRFTGRLNEGGGPFELIQRCVVRARAGLITNVELFDEDAEPGMLGAVARLWAARLPSPPAPTMQRVGAVVIATPRPAMATFWQRHIEKTCGAANARDWTTAKACLAPDLVAIDRRKPSTFGEIHGRDAYIEYVRGVPDLADDAFLSTAQFAGDDHLGIGHSWWTGHIDDGGGEFALERVLVSTVGEHGCERFEWFDPDDESAAVERLLELQSDDEIRSAWRPQLALLLVANGRDWSALTGCFTDDTVLDDRRGEPGAAASAPGFVRSLLDAMRDGRAAVQFLDASRDSAMSRLQVRGGAAQTAIGLVMALRDGRIARLEVFDPDDVLGMRASFEALRVRGRDKESPPLGSAARVVQLLADRANARDLAGVFECYGEDFVAFDRRSLSLRGRQTREQTLAVTREMLSASSDARFEIEHLGEVEGVWHGRATWAGHQDNTGGAFEIPIRGVIRCCDGVAVHGEVFDVDDEVGSLRALCRLVGGGDGQPGPVTDLWVHVTEAISRGALDELRASLTADHEIVDRRRTVSMVGADAVERVRAFYAVASDIVMTAEPLAEVDGIAMVINRYAGHMNEGGGPFELAQRCVVMARDGLVCHTEIVNEDDEADMLAAFARLRARPRLGSAARLVHRLAECMNSRDLDGYRDCCVEDLGAIDRRSISVFGRFSSRAEAMRWTRQMFAASSDTRWECVDIGELDGVWLGRGTWVGHLDETGGAFETPTRYLFPTRGDVITRIEAFDVEDEVGSLRALCRLAGGGDGATGPATRLLPRMVDAVNRRAWDEVRALQAPDQTSVDHRGVVGLGFSGLRIAERAQTLVSLAGDMVFTVDPLAELGGVAMVKVRSVGHMDEGGGPFELNARGVFQVSGGQFTRFEFFDEGDEAGMLAALARLRASPLLGPAARVTQRLYDCGNERDWDGLRQLLAEDHVTVDQRRLSLFGRLSADGVVAMARELATSASDARLDVEHIGELDGVVSDQGHPFRSAGRDRWLVRDDVALRARGSRRCLYPRRDLRLR